MLHGGGGSGNVHDQEDVPYQKRVDEYSHRGRVKVKIFREGVDGRDYIKG